MISFLRTSLLTFCSLFCILISTARADISGRWVCHFNLNGSGDYPQDMLLVDSGGTVTGQEFYTGTNNAFANISGTSSGNNFSIRADYISINYYAIIDGSVSGSSMSGNWHNASQAGGFTCSLSGNVTPTPTPGGSTSGKRATAISLFCNRNGVGLSNADCSVTVADKGAPPRSAPTGVVNFTATNGFFPGSGSCTLQQTQFSPGIVSCAAQFAVPFGFPIGAAFPIDATYPGDTNFSGSSTGHQLIQAGCVGDQEHPCSGAVALSFADLPRVLKNAIAAIAGCGGGLTNKSLPSAEPSTTFLSGCFLSLSSSGDVGSMLTSLGLTQAQLIQIGDAISQQSANNDATLNALREMFRKAGTDTNYYNQVNFDADAMNAELLRIIRESKDKKPARINRAISKWASIFPRRKKLNVVFGTVETIVKTNKQKGVKIKLNILGKGLFKALKAGGVPTVNLNIKMKSQRVGVVPKGIKKKVSSTLALDVVL